MYRYHFAPVCVYATTGSEEIAEQICLYLRHRLPEEMQEEGGIRLEKHKIERYPNHNMLVQVNNARNRFVVVVSTQTGDVDGNLIELFHLLDALTDADPGDIMVVFPYMSYARADKKDKPRISTFARRLADFINGSFGIKRVLLLDPHDDHVKSYFRPTAETVSAMYLVADYLERRYFTSRHKDDYGFVLGDAGAVKRYKKIPRQLGMRFGFIDKERSGDDDRAEAQAIIGDFHNLDAVLFDDEIASGGTVKTGVKILSTVNCHVRLMVSIHPVLEPGIKAMTTLRELRIPEFVFTDSIPLGSKPVEGIRITILPVGGLLGEAIAREATHDSLTELHDPAKVDIYRSITPPPE